MCRGGHAGQCQGDGRGPGRPWRGIVEDTPCIWITWIVALAKRMGKPMEGLRIEAGGRSIEVTSVELTFGRRWYFVCPECGKRREALYLLDRLACRECLRLGYRSQTHIPGSPWAIWGRIFDRDYFPRRWRRLPPSMTEAFAEMIRRIAAKGAERIIEEIQLLVEE